MKKSNRKYSNNAKGVWDIHAPFSVAHEIDEIYNDSKINNKHIG